MYMQWIPCMIRPESLHVNDFTMVATTAAYRYGWQQGGYCQTIGAHLGCVAALQEFGVGVPDGRRHKWPIGSSLACKQP